MGHIRLGELPRTGYWPEVIKWMKVTDDAGIIAAKTAKAAHKGLEMAKADAGVAAVAFMLMKGVWSAKEADFAGALKGMGITMGEGATFLDFVGEFDKAVDAKLRAMGRRTDLAEMARHSAVDALTDACKRQTKSLFGVSAEETKETLKACAGRRFGTLGRRFFGRFLYRFLDYHVSRELANDVGRGRTHESVTDAAAFRRALERHCVETVRIVKEFAECWPSVTAFRGGITADNVRTKFLPVALMKINKELEVRSGGKKGRRRKLPDPV